MIRKTASFLLCSVTALLIVFISSFALFAACIARMSSFALRKADSRNSVRSAFFDSRKLFLTDCTAHADASSPLP